MTGDKQEYPELTWQEIRDHLFEQLLLDDEWVSEEDESLRWQPGLFPMTVRVIDQGEFADGSGDIWRRVNAHTVIMTATEDEGAALAQQFRPSYPLGSIFWDEGYLIASTTIGLSNRSRDLLGLLHMSVLTQATAVAILVRTLLSDTAEEQLGALIGSLQDGDNQLGSREIVDDLLWTFDPTTPIAVNDVMEEAGAEIIADWKSARPLYEQIMSSRMQPGYADDTVAFFQDETGMTIAVGPDDDSLNAQTYGPGLSVMCIARILEEDLGTRFVDGANRELAVNGHSHIGHVELVGPTDGAFALEVSTFLSPGVIRPGNPAHLAITTVNIVEQVLAGARALLPEGS